MPVITGLEFHQRDKERVKLFLDDEFVLDLPLMEAARLRRGQSLTEAEVLELTERSATSSRLLTVPFAFYPTDHAVLKKFAAILSRKRFRILSSRSLLSDCKQRGYVDDLEFARFWIANRERFKPMGSRALKYELRQKGVDDEIMDVALAEVDESESAYRAAEARCRGTGAWRAGIQA